jgi:glycosyltransferase involved in cell wall biosynthesis
MGLQSMGEVEMISAVILTHNEESNIGYCLESIRRISNIYVVDSGSTDNTINICKRFGTHVFRHAYANHADQWQWALDSLPIVTPWILALDADFVVTRELLDRISREIDTLGEDIGGVYVRHFYNFGRGMIRFGGTKKYWLRIIRRGCARADTSDFVDFRFHVDRHIVRWHEAIIEHNHKDDDISIWIAKQDKFSLRLAVEEELRRRGLHAWDRTPRLFGTIDEKFAWLRDRWLKLPLFVRPVLYFVYRYVIAAGFLDGRAGFLYHALQGFWLRLVVDWKIVQLRGMGLDDRALRNFSRVMFESHSGSVVQVEVARKAIEGTYSQKQKKEPG